MMIIVIERHLGISLSLSLSLSSRAPPRTPFIVATFGNIHFTVSRLIFGGHIDTLCRRGEMSRGSSDFRRRGRENFDKTSTYFVFPLGDFEIERKPTRSWTTLLENRDASQKRHRQLPCMFSAYLRKRDGINRVRDTREPAVRSGREIQVRQTDDARLRASGVLDIKFSFQRTMLIKSKEGRAISSDTGGPLISRSYSRVTCTARPSLAPPPSLPLRARFRVFIKHAAPIGPRLSRQMGTKVPTHSENTCSRPRGLSVIPVWSRFHPVLRMPARDVDKHALPSRSLLRSAPHEAKPIQSP